MLAKFGTNSGDITWWSNFELIQLEPNTNLEPMQVEFYLAGDITQVIDSIPWVRCASGNVLPKLVSTQNVQYFPLKLIICPPKCSLFYSNSPTMCSQN